jgi:prephenate dehydrogenase
MTPDIGLIGRGRFGTYFRGQLEAVGYQVAIADIIDDAPAWRRDVATVCAAPIVIYAVPIRALESAIVDTRTFIGPDAVVIDVSSVKVMPCQWLERHLPGVRKAGTHPLFGPQSAPPPGSCAGHRVALCPLPTHRGSPPDAEAAAVVRAMLLRLGVNIIECTPADHDRQVARSQFLTHFIGRGAMAAEIGRVALSTKTHDALMDIVDVVGRDSLALFEDMAVFNPEARVARAEFMSALQSIADRLIALELTKQ